MSAIEEHDAQPKRRGRPRVKQPPSGFVRRNLLVDPQALERLRKLYNATSDSEAVRLAVETILVGQEIDEVVDRIAAHGGPLDVYERTTGVSRLPVHPKPEDIIDADKEWY
ncbi:MAG: hypothetical protein M3Y74_00625 [Chloroflexota bacterium]|nr:hypothetical protein [Chloroflexota bacterium]